jgi:hypothetical protein
MSAKRRNRRRVEPTDEWEALASLFLWPEQENYEVMRPLVLFGSPVAERAERTGVSEREPSTGGPLASRTKGWRAFSTPGLPVGAAGSLRR